MGKTVKIAPIPRTFNSNFKTMESSLAGYGYTRTPGTKRLLGPKIEADGRYRTGLDKKALYLKKLSDEERAAEELFIDKSLATLKESYPDTDFGPRSKVWNAFSEEGEVHTSYVPLSNGIFILNIDDNVTELLTYCWLRVHPDIARSLESFNRGECQDCQYYLMNEEAETKALYSKKKEINNAKIAFDALPPTKKKQTARLLGLPVGDSTTDEAVYNMIDNLLNSPIFSSGEHANISTISVFNDILKLSDDRLNVKDIIEQAIRHNIYRKGTGDKIMEGSQVISASKEDLVTYLLDDDNQKELMALDVKLKGKKIAAL